MKAALKIQHFFFKIKAKSELNIDSTMLLHQLIKSVCKNLNLISEDSNKFQPITKSFLLKSLMNNPIFLQILKQEPLNNRQSKVEYQSSNQKLKNCKKNGQCLYFSPIIKNNHNTSFRNCVLNLRENLKKYSSKFKNQSKYNLKYLPLKKQNQSNKSLNAFYSTDIKLIKRSPQLEKFFKKYCHYEKKKETSNTKSQPKFNNEKFYYNKHYSNIKRSRTPIDYSQSMGLRKNKNCQILKNKNKNEITKNDLIKNSVQVALKDLQAKGSPIDNKSIINKDENAHKKLCKNFCDYTNSQSQIPLSVSLSTATQSKKIFGPIQEAQFPETIILKDLNFLLNDILSTATLKKESISNLQSQVFKFRRTREERKKERQNY